MLLVETNRVRAYRVDWVKSVVHAEPWPIEEIEPADESVPLHIEKLGKNTWRVDYWYKSKVSHHIASHLFHSEAHALEFAANIVRSAKQCAA